MIRACIAVLLLLAMPVSAEDVLARALAQLERSEHISGRFVQEKQLAFLPRPFVSAGVFELDAKSGLIWQVRQPLSSRMTVHAGRVEIDGQVVQDQGVGRLMAQIMLGFMAGDLSGITEHFEISAAPDEVDTGLPWQLRLTPKARRLQMAIKYLQLAGDSALRELIIAEADNNATRISMTPDTVDVERDESSVALELGDSIEKGEKSEKSEKAQ